MMQLHLLEIGAGRVAETVGSASIAGLWQGIVLAAATALILRLMPKTTAAARFVIWTAVFLVSVAMPFVQLFQVSRLSPADSVARVQIDVRWSYILAGLWAGAVLVRMAALVMHGVGLRSLWKSASPIERIAFEEFTYGLRVQVCTTAEVDRPCVVGFFAPRILIPGWLLAQLTEVELRHIVLHEMQHLRRRDDWTNLFQKIGLVVFPLNPALFWIDRRLSAEREIACDDGVLELTKTPRAYAASLTSIAERRLSVRLSQRVVALALAAIGVKGADRRSEFGRRIEGILGNRATVRPVVATGLAVVLVAGIVGAAAEMVRVPNLVAFAGGKSVQTAEVTDSPGVGMVQAEVARRSPIPRVEFRAVSYRVPEKTVVRPSSIVTKREKAKTLPALAKTVLPVRQVDVNYSNPAKSEGRFVILTTWEQPSGVDIETNQVPVSRVVVKMSDGRFVVTPYAAVPTQAGWLIVQL